MDPQITRILLSVVLWPVAVTLYFASFFLMAENNIGEEYAFIWTGIGVGFVMVVWLVLVWRSQVRWTPRRVLQTSLSVPAAAGLGALWSWVMESILAYGRGWGLSIFIGTLVSLSAWPVMAVLIWRENKEERRRRSATVSCPGCGYDLTGLSECRCPECGVQYTIDKLYAAQPRPLVGSGVSS